MSGKFVLIASYPKSGNTWTRIVLEKLRFGPSLSMNNLDGSFHGHVRRVLFDVISPVDSSNLLADEIDMLLPDVFRQICAESNDMMFMKVHDSARRTSVGQLLYPPDTVSSVVYLVRHPFDVAVSTAHHFGLSMERAVAFMQDGRMMRNAYTWLPEPLPEYYGNWSENVSTWLDGPYPLTLSRYEDLLADPLKEFRRIAGSVGLEASEDQLRLAIETSRFETLQAEEQAKGFRERPITSSRFFREGKAGTWQGSLSPELCAKIVDFHGPVMQRLGYAANGALEPLSPVGGQFH